MGGHAVVDNITEYQQLRQLPSGTLIRDSSGEVWQVTKYINRVRPDQPEETWLCHFSDEYAFIVRQDSTHAHGNQPSLPMKTIQELR